MRIYKDPKTGQFFYYTYTNQKRVISPGEERPMLRKEIAVPKEERS